MRKRKSNRIYLYNLGKIMFAGLNESQHFVRQMKVGFLVFFVLLLANVSSQVQP